VVLRGLIAVALAAAAAAAAQPDSKVIAGHSVKGRAIVAYERR
jgi:hypothetical protein